jgi:alpha/beta superfamily hydrolase
MLDLPRDTEPVGAAVVCHPHPQHGGTMHNKVAHTLARTFSRLGFAALRFNFRGTEGSEGRWDEGRGEVDDALAAAHFMRTAYRGLPLWISGFSFGAAMAIKAAQRESFAGLVSVAPAVSRFHADPGPQPGCPWLIVQGDADELVAADETIAWVNSLEPGPELVILPDAEHFFHGRLVDLREAVTAFVSAYLGDQSQGSSA